MIAGGLLLVRAPADAEPERARHSAEVVAAPAASAASRPPRTRAAAHGDDGFMLFSSSTSVARVLVREHPNRGRAEPLRATSISGSSRACADVCADPHRT